MKIFLISLISILSILTNNITLSGIVIPLQNPTVQEKLETIVDIQDNSFLTETDITNDPEIKNNGTKEIKVYNSNYVIPDNLSTNLNNVIQKYSGLKIGIYAISLKDYTCIGYNESSAFDTASTVKAPFALYVMKEIAKGNHTLTEKVTYTEKHYNSGSGTIKSTAYGTEFTVKELITYMINCSDNIAYLMLQDHFGYEGYNEMVSELGCTIWLNGYTKWGRFTAEELAIIWNEIYNFSNETEEGKFLMQLLIDARYNFIKESLGRYSKVAHKSGFTPNSYNDAAIIFTESDLNPELGTANDYIVVVMATPGNTGYNKTALGELTKAIDLIMRDLATKQ